MKITKIEVKHYEMPLDPPFRAAWDPVARTRFPAIKVFVHTDEGLTGVGSSDIMVGFSGQENLFIGQDPFEIERHWKVLDRIDFHYGRCWPLDLAPTWNLKTALAVSDCPFLEFPFDPPAWTPERRDFPSMSEDQTMIDQDGYLKLPGKPGLGFDLDEKALARYEVESTHWGD